MSERPSLRTTGSTVVAAENIVAWLRPVLQGDNPDQVRMIERHIGQFSTPSEVKTYLSDRSGCIRIAALKVRNIRHRAGGTSGDVTWAAYVMATDAWGYSRDTRCEVLVGRLARRLATIDAPDGMQAERAAESISADNIYSGALNDIGITMWAVTWVQAFRLDDEVDLATLPDFLRLGATLVVNGGETDLKDVINVREPAP